jgi:hypothetical protein
MKKRVVIVLGMLLILLSIFFLFSFSSSSEGDSLEIGKKDWSEPSKYVGENRNCVAFSYRARFYDSSENFKCWYDSSDGKIKSSSNRGWVDCFYICADNPDTLEELEFGSVDVASKDQPKTKDIGANRNCVTFVSNFCRPYKWIEFSCVYEKSSGIVSASVDGAYNPGGDRGRCIDDWPKVSCGYICLD